MKKAYSATLYFLTIFFVTAIIIAAQHIYRKILSGPELFENIVTGAVALVSFFIVPSALIRLHPPAYAIFRPWFTDALSSIKTTMIVLVFITFLVSFSSLFISIAEQMRLHGNLNMRQTLRRFIKIISFGPYIRILIEAPILAFGGAILWRNAVRRFYPSNGASRRRAG